VSISHQAPQVIIVGGGLAGLAAASALGTRGLRVTVLESRDRLGGRAGSFVDGATGQLIDACQHVSMGCCTNLAHFWRTMGVAHLLRPQPALYFMTADRRVSRFAADPLPAPFHLARAFLTAHHLSLADKGRIAYGLAQMRLTPAEDDRPFTEWLRQHQQTPSAVRRFWGLVLVSALNEDVERVGLKYARKVFYAFLRHRDGFVVEIPTVPLGRLYGAEMLAWLGQHNVEVRLNAGVRRIRVEQGRATGVELRNGEVIEGDWVISTVPHTLLQELLPESVTNHEYFVMLKTLETSPITSVHLWYDRSVMRLPHAVLVDCVGQWVFNRGQTAPAEHYVQVVVSASRAFRSLGHDAVMRLITEEMVRLFPRAASAHLLRARVVAERNATFSVVPGVDRIRPAQTSPVPRLLTAGDWTRTDWPATMEGAVRSGYLAAEALLRAVGRPERLVVADLHHE
jgi:squalene-associated FAD-dependent desaturase